MEEFGDLSALLSGRTGSIVDTIVSTDELSTPVFDFKGPFNYLSPERHENHEDDEISIKLESSSIPSNNGDYRHSSYLINNNNHNNNNNVDIFEQMANFNNNRHNCSTTDNGSKVVLHVQQQQQQQKMEQSPQDDRYSYISSPELAVPERFDHAYHRAASRPAALHLATFQPPCKAGTTDALVLNTPDVIEGVVSMGTEFNILDLVNNEDITVVSADSEFLTSLASAHTSNPSTPPSKEASRKRAGSPSSSSSLHSEEEEGEDEEWMPPTTPTIKYSELDHLPPVKKRRGRPPKRPDSVTSGESGDVSKYRELRDKNNEASRKSRLKRKIKEKEYEREADELQMRNVRLKAQVEELEKMVSTFRNNLFKILVRK
ncbi:kinesin-related protein 12 [Anthonomus grandis grandis]|uniref:kinesin-related protein 12 n=1 Tax=Anthonomus grandis grandis TaxID=2921223 RepID=UPI002166A489|nr:kinesin-related protein 12 [Anthonomus grandis grandis]